MKIRILKKLAGFAVLAGMFTCTSCQKELQSSNSDAAAAMLADSSTTADNAFNDGMTNALYGYSDNVATAVADRKISRVTTNSTAGQALIPLSCAVATIVTTNGGFPVRLTLDFGSGCSGPDNIKRSGKITCLYNGPLYTPGSGVAVNFDHYTVNGYGLQGIYTLSNTSGDSLPQFKQQITNGLFSYPDGTNFNYSCNKLVTMTGGAQTPFYFPDDVYSITGNSNFSSSGNSVVLTVTTPLRRSIACPVISAGVISFVYNTRIKGTIDFGNGDCDNMATLTSGSLVKTIALR